MKSNDRIKPKFVFNIIEMLTPAIIVFLLLVISSILVIFTIGLEWPFTFSGLNNRVGGVMLNLSYSFMAAFLFWFCTVYIVERYEQSKTLIACQPLIDEIYGTMSYMNELMRVVEDGGIVVKETQGKDGHIFTEKHFNTKYNCFAMSFRKYNNGEPEYEDDTYSLFCFPMEIINHFNLMHTNIDVLIKDKDHLPKYLVYLLVALRDDVYLTSLPIFLKTHLLQRTREVGFNLPGKMHILSDWQRRFKRYTKTNVTYSMSVFDELRTDKVIEEIKREMYMLGDIWKNQPCRGASGLYLYPYLENLIKEG